MAATCLNVLLEAGVDAMYCKECKLLTKCASYAMQSKRKNRSR